MSDDPLDSTRSTSTTDDLNELCRLLNEERRTMYQLTDQWKQNTKATIDRLEQQIITYQKKLNELEHRQAKLINENRFLKGQLEKVKKKSSHVGL